MFNLKKYNIIEMLSTISNNKGVSSFQLKFE